MERLRFSCAHSMSVLLKDRFVAEALGRFAEITLALVGIGATEPSRGLASWRTREKAGVEKGMRLASASRRRITVRASVQEANASPRSAARAEPPRQLHTKTPSSRIRTAATSRNITSPAMAPTALATGAAACEGEV